MTKHEKKHLKPTQLQQVLAAVKTIGKGTPKTVYAQIEKLYGAWNGAKKPTASVSMYLTKNKDTIFKKEDGFWVLQSGKTQAKPTGKKSVGKPKNRGLYLITLSSNVNLPAAGFLFKIGESGDVIERLIAYSACLPVETIHEVSFYPIPDNVNLKEAEKEVTGELL